MNFKKIRIEGDFWTVLHKQEKLYFERARNIGDKYKSTVHADRKWVTDVITSFAERMNLTIGQAIQLLQSGSAIYARAIYARRAMNLPQTVMGTSGTPIANPARQRLIDLSQMEPKDINSLALLAFDRAIGVAHPLKVVADRGFQKEHKSGEDNIKVHILALALVAGLRREQET